MPGCLCKVVASYSVCEFWAMLCQGECLWPCFYVAHYGEPVLALGTFPFPLCLRLCGHTSEQRTHISAFVYRLCRSLSVCKPPLLMCVVRNVGAAKVPLHTQWLHIVEEGKFCFLKSTTLPAPIFLRLIGSC